MAEDFCSSDIGENKTVGISFQCIQVMSSAWGLQSPGSSDSRCISGFVLMACICPESRIESSLGTLEPQQGLLF